MQRALALAEQGRATVSPNPMVGCVIVQQGTVVGEGWHERPGGPHAEIVALEQARAQAQGATAYVTLEPCNHHGRTPPCSEALIRAGVAQVVIAARDPNPTAAGGSEQLEAAGIRVMTGVLEDDARTQNEVFFTVHQKRRPFVLYKTAMSLDGKIATRTGASRWITGEAARARVHSWRAELDAIAVGVNTVLHDDPRLTCRLPGARSPIKIIFDSVARTPVDAALFEADEHAHPAEVFVMTTSAAPEARRQALQARGAKVIALPAEHGRSRVGAALEHLHRQGVNSILLEGGGTLAWSFFEAQAVDRVAVFIAPKLLGGSGASPLAGLGVSGLEEALRLETFQTETLAQDLLISGPVHYPPGVIHPKKQDATAASTPFER